MLIDFHIHAFTDEIAQRAVERLVNTAKIKNYTDGTEKATRDFLAENNIDYGVLLPIATKPTQQKTINDWAASVSGGSIISFGTVHPDAEDALDELERIKSLGLKGIKLHPDYQNVFVFSENCIKVFRRCAELDLPVSIHMGYDPVSPLVHRALPQDLLYVREKAPNVKLIAAHLGGMFCWDAVLHYLCGDRSIWLDTAYIGGFIDPSLLRSIVEKHGDDRILFGSDLPWHNPSSEKALIEQIGLSDKSLDRIFAENAAELLKMTF